MTGNNQIPTHVGLILDGNRRWAKERGLKPIEGHKKGYDTFRDIADAALKKGIRFLTVFAFSTENWQRANEEVAFLMSFTAKILRTEIKNLHKQNIRFVWLGSEDGLDTKLVKSLRDAETLTAQNDGGTFCYCFNYGGQAEIAEAAESLRTMGTKITVDSLANALYAPEIPPIDFIIRTSGEQRISNFMLWRAAYSELYFTKVYWPDFSVADLDVALADYAARQRRFGQ
jgi:undecaprenyl diphosphate synthase